MVKHPNPGIDEETYTEAKRLMEVFDLSWEGVVTEAVEILGLAEEIREDDYTPASVVIREAVKRPEPPDASSTADSSGTSAPTAETDDSDESDMNKGDTQAEVSPEDMPMDEWIEWRIIQISEDVGDTLPGTGEKLEARKEALRQCLLTLQLGGLEKRHIIRDVYERGYTGGFDTADGWWNAMSDALRRIHVVEGPESNRGEWKLKRDAL